MKLSKTGKIFTGIVILILFLIAAGLILNYVHSKQYLGIKYKENSQTSVEQEDDYDEDIIPETYESEIDAEASKLIGAVGYMYNSAGISVPVDNEELKKCLFKVQGVCFGQPFFARGISYMDCKKNITEYGIASCNDSDDIYASTAIICGGTQNMPTTQDLAILAKDLYGTDVSNENILDSHYSLNYIGYNKEDLTRNNNKDYLEYFRNAYWPDPNFRNATQESSRNEFNFGIISRDLVDNNDEGGTNFVIYRSFYNSKTQFGAIRRKHDFYDSWTVDSYSLNHNPPMPYSVCITR